MPKIKFSTWEVSPKEAVRIQNHLRNRVVRKNTLAKIRTVAGVDVSYRGGIAKAAVVVLDYETLELVDYSRASLPVNFPYIPGLLAFREGPAVEAAINNLKIEPDVYIFDAQGVAHPRRLGLASHLGVVINRPTVGCAKSRLVGLSRKPVKKRVGAFEYLFDKGEVVGVELRTHPQRKTVFVSVGHLVNLEKAVSLVLHCVKRGRRLPETTVMAHRLVSKR